MPRSGRSRPAIGRCSGGQLLVGLASAQLAGEDFLVGLDRQRADVAGQLLAPVAALSSTTAAGLARKFHDGQWRAVETGIGDIDTAMLAALPPARAAALCEAVTIDLDTTDGPTDPRNGGSRSITRGNAAGARTWPPGRRPRQCWPRT